jgi:hypothetical protein
MNAQPQIPPFRNAIQQFFDQEITITDINVLLKSEKRMVDMIELYANPHPVRGPQNGPQILTGIRVEYNINTNEELMALARYKITHALLTGILSGKIVCKEKENLQRLRERISDYILSYYDLPQLCKDALDGLASEHNCENVWALEKLIERVINEYFMDMANDRKLTRGYES